MTTTEKPPWFAASDIVSRISLNPALGQIVLTWMKRRLRKKSLSQIQDPQGFCLAILRNPRRFGFAQRGGRWIAPRL
jgi:hypothetical protein